MNLLQSLPASELHDQTIRLPERVSPEVSVEEQHVRPALMFVARVPGLESLKGRVVMSVGNVSEKHSRGRGRGLVERSA